MNVSISAAKTANINEPVYLFSRSTWKRKKPKAAETTTANRSDACALIRGAVHHNRIVQFFCFCIVAQLVNVTSYLLTVGIPQSFEKQRTS